MRDTDPAADPDEPRRRTLDAVRGRPAEAIEQVERHVGMARTAYVAIPDAVSRLELARALLAD